jgi:hypothetical protein
MITLSILAALSPPRVWAVSDNPELIITGAEIKEGEKAAVTVSLSANPNVTTFSIVLKYDPGRLTVDSYDWGHSVSGVSSLSKNISNDPVNGKIQVSFMSLAVLPDTEELIKVTFTAKQLSKGEQSVQTHIERRYEGYYTGFLVGESTMKYNLSAGSGVIRITAQITGTAPPGEPESPDQPKNPDQPKSSDKTENQPDGPKVIGVPETAGDPATGNTPETAGSFKTIYIPETNWSNPFKDVRENDWFYGAVQYVYTQKLMIGTAADTFSWDKSLTRAMIVTVLYRLSGSPETGGYGNPFKDVKDGLWYTDAVKWASATGIVLGYGNGRFGTDDPVTNEQLATLIYRIQQYSGYAPPVSENENKYLDWHKVSVWASTAADTLLAQGVFSDLPGTAFNPQSPAIRAGIASILYRYATL